MKLRLNAVAFAAAALALGQSAWAGEAEAKKWIDSEFQPSTLTKEQQTAEMKWFIEAAKKLQAKGVKEISVVSETITTHEYESKTLAKAFEEITGIKVKHDLIQEGDVVEKLQTSMQSGKSIYDGWISDSDLIGTHYRYGKIMNLTDYMAGKGKEWTNPGLDLKDFIGTSFTTAPDKKLYQLPDQQFANLYWFRADLFARQDLKDKFKAKYGYDLGVPLNWSAYEDIAEFFSNDVKTIDGKPIYGHMDYGKKDPSLGWRFTDAWLSMAGTADIGIPNGMPVDEWGIRVAADECTPVGASVSRGGATNSPAAVYALTKYVDWMKKYAPKEATGMTFGEAGPVPAQGQIAQQIFWYTAFTADMTKAGPAGGQRRRHAEVAHGARPERPVLEAGHAERLPGRRLVDLLRQPRREQDGGGLAVRAVRHRQDDVAEEDDRRPDADPRERHPARGDDRHGAQARRPGRVLPQPGARRVDADRHQRARLPEAGAALVEERGAVAVTGEKTPQAAMDTLADEMDQVMARLERAGMAHCAPKLNPKGDPNKWLSDKGAPWKKLANEKPKGETIAYEKLLNAWKEGKVR